MSVRHLFIGLLYTICAVPTIAAAWFAWDDLISVDLESALMPLGLGFALSTLFYTALNLHFIQRGLRNNRRQFAMDIVRDWCTGDMRRVQEDAAEVRQKALKWNPEEITQYFTKNDKERMVFTQVMNYLEFICCGIKYRAADEQVIRDYFSPICDMYLRAFGDYITHFRSRTDNPEAFVMFTDRCAVWGLKGTIGDLPSVSKTGLSQPSTSNSEPGRISQKSPDEQGGQH